ncbi:hypothetical protein FNV43_RR05975 [Rhamnella rubrinervis]|uniref:Uncharacterized protein n=1 Tax=Rhamnella rubrinervis TaxID=2594499 RepID=A0A8K0HC75_9ROSA|nr:hypothetical protein FNV43_RR05975 [Rhamnella rubrinervis]
MPFTKSQPAFIGLPRPSIILLSLQLGNPLSQYIFVLQYLIGGAPEFPTWCLSDWIVVYTHCSIASEDSIGRSNGGSYHWTAQIGDQMATSVRLRNCQRRWKHKEERKPRLENHWTRPHAPLKVAASGTHAPTLK